MRVHLSSRTRRNTMQAVRAAAVALATAAMTGCVQQPAERSSPEVHLQTINATLHTTQITGIARWSLDKGGGAITLRGYGGTGAVRFYIKHGAAGMEAEAHSPVRGHPDRIERIAIADDGRVVEHSVPAKSRLMLALKHLRRDSETDAQRATSGGRSAALES